MGYKPSISLVKPFELWFGITVALRSLNATAKRFSRAARTYRAKATPKNKCLLIMVSGVRLSDGAPNGYNPKVIRIYSKTPSSLNYSVFCFLPITKKNYGNKIIQIIPTIIIAKTIIFLIVLFKYNLSLSATSS